MATVFLLFPVYLFVCSRCWAADVDVSAPRPGRVFFAGETIRLALSSPEKTDVTCKVYDHLGHLWVTQDLVLPPGRPKELRLGILPPGWYRLRIYSNGRIVREDAFGVIRRYASYGCHEGLFGACVSLESQQIADIFSFAGICSIRRDWGWPTVEPNEGQWRSEHVDAIMTRAIRAGLDFVPILGYAPRFVGVRPIDATGGRPAVAGHTWPISDKRKWVDFLHWCKSKARSMPSTSWPPERLDEAAYSRERRPAVRAWEIWNEADQNFYYGPWHQYCDLLRLAHAVLDTPQTPVLYGGSCGHWTETGMAYSWGLRAFFDFAAGHPGGDVDESMPGWVFGAQSIGYKFGAPYELWFTESYFHPSSADMTFPEYVLLLYAKLRHWDIEESYRGQGIKSVSRIDPATDQYICRIDNDLVVTPAYVATAFARWLIVDAAYAGRFKLQPQIEAYAFIRKGQPLLIVHSLDRPRRVTLRVNRHGKLMDYMGRVVSQPRYGKLVFTASRSPRVVLGCSWKYIARAAQARLQEYLSSQFGANPSPPRWSCYVSTISEDLDSYAPGASLRLKSAALRAFARLARGPQKGYLGLRWATFRALYSLLRLVPKTREQATDSRRFDTTWRMCKLCEWLAELYDQVSLAAKRRYSTRLIQREALRNLGCAWARAISKASGTEKYHARSLARRAQRTLQRARRMNGYGLFLAGMIEAKAAAKLAALEPPVLTRIIAFAEFPDAPFVVKGHLMPPGRPHTVRLVVCNETPYDRNVVVHIRFPNGWEPAEKHCSGRVEAYSTALIDTVTVTPPAEGKWVRTSSWRPGTPLLVFCPENLPTNQQVEVWAEVDGRASAHCYYFFNMGQLTKPDSSLASVPNADKP